MSARSLTLLPDEPPLRELAAGGSSGSGPLRAAAAARARAARAVLRRVVEDEADRERLAAGLRVLLELDGCAPRLRAVGFFAVVARARRRRARGRRGRLAPPPRAPRCAPRATRSPCAARAPRPGR